MAEIAFWLGALGFIYGGIDVLRKGMKISSNTVITGPAGTAIGILLILAGIAIGAAASVYLRMMAR